MQQPKFGMFYADESGQETPVVQNMGSLVSAGGIYVPALSAAPLQETVNYVCGSYGCPAGEEFKWNAPKKSWLQQLGARRSDFYREILQACVDSGVTANVVVVEKGHYPTHEVSLTRAFQWLLERVQFTAQEQDEVCGLIADRRSAVTKHDDQFVGDLLQTIYQGTDFVMPKSIHWAVSSDSRNIRSLQIADLVVGCTTQFVAGRLVHTEKLIGKVHDLLRKNPNGNVENYGLKLWPGELYDRTPSMASVISKRNGHRGQVVKPASNHWNPFA